MKNLISKLTFLSLIIIMATACSREEQVTMSEISLEVVFPKDYSGSKKDAEIKWENIDNKMSGIAQTDEQGVAKISLENGNYNFYVVKKENAINYQGTENNVNISEDKQIVKVKVAPIYTSATWVIKEVYFSGSKTPQGKSYKQDQYIEIYNNSNETLYADGLIFCKTYDNTQLNPNWGQYLEKNEIVPSLILQVPGDGKEHPVKPGESLLLAKQGTNHTIDNPNSPVDLSKSDFEWYEGTASETDSPEVPNLRKYYSSSRSFTILHNRGYEGYFIIQIPVSETQKFLDKHPATTKMPNGSTKNSYAIPSSYIIDAVQCSKPEGYKSVVFPSFIDGGYTYTDGANTGKCVQRKFLKDNNGKAVLKDTNNSTNDFTPNATPSPRKVVR